MDAPPSRHGILVPRATLWLFALLVLLPWLAVLRLARPPTPPTAPAAPRATPAAAAADSAFVQTCHPGPWGDLQFSRIVIEPPESQIGRDRLVPQPTLWYFKGYTAATLAELWRAAGATDSQVRTVTDPAQWQPAPDGPLLRPTADFVLSLTEATRGQIYSALAQIPENGAHADPYRFRADAADEWFRHSGLSPATIDLIKRLVYRRGTSLVFSDPNLVLATLPTLAERTRLIKTLSRKSTLLVKLRISPDTDIEALDAYWGRRQRTKDIQPLLQSLVREGGTATIDLAHLLPRLPRSLLYTYPAPDENGSSTFLDCHWTVLNFYNPIPDDRYQHLEAVTEAFARDYYSVTGPRTYGDILMFARPDGSVIHSCLYLADDIVFTKNGASTSSPWILMSLPDVVAFYPAAVPLDIQTYRAKAAAMPGM